MQLPSPGSEKELESIDVGDGPGLRQARKEEHGRTTLGDWLVLMGPDGQTMSGTCSWPDPRRLAEI